MPQIEIRPANTADIPILVAFDHGYQSNYVWQMDYVNEEGQVNVNFREIRLPRSVRVEYPRSPKKLADDWNSRSAVLVGVLENVPVAYISINEEIAPTSAWITDLAVNPAVRRQGIGSTLLLAAQDWAVQRKKRRVILEAQSKNLAAIRIAQKLGYEFCGYNDHYYMNQDIVLFFGLFLR